jgi:HK97 family phage prohead protease
MTPTPNPKPDTRTLVATLAEVRAASKDDGTIEFEGYAAVFDSLSEDLGGFREIIKPGAFDRGLAGADVRALINHDPCKLLGRTKSKTCDLSVDARGLRFQIRSAATSYARDLALNIGRGDMDGCSFRFYVAEGGDSWERDRAGVMIRSLTDIEIDDVSIVTYPAYTASAVSMRSKDRLGEAIRAADGRSPHLAHQRRLIELARFAK